MAIDIKRALTDPEYRKSLTPEELAELPENPAGDAEISEEDLDDVAGGRMCQSTTGSCLASKRTTMLGCGC